MPTKRGPSSLLKGQQSSNISPHIQKAFIQIMIPVDQNTSKQMSKKKYVYRVNRKRFEKQQNSLPYTTFKDELSDKLKNGPKQWTLQLGRHLADCRACYQSATSKAKCFSSPSHWAQWRSTKVIYYVIVCITRNLAILCRVWVWMLECVSMKRVYFIMTIKG